MQRKGLVLALAALLAGGGALLVQPVANQVRADEYKRPRQLKVPADAPELWKSECGSCHMVYPPALLPAKAWQQHMGSLGAHYGSDASLDPATTQQILDFLQRASAGNRLPVESAGRAGEPPKISETRWFKRRHHEVSAKKFARESVGGPGNCVACHRNAEEGRFGKVKIPR